MGYIPVRWPRVRKEWLTGKNYATFERISYSTSGCNFPKSNVPKPVSYRRVSISTALRVRGKGTNTHRIPTSGRGEPISTTAGVRSTL